MWAQGNHNASYKMEKWGRRANVRVMPNEKDSTFRCWLWRWKRAWAKGYKWPLEPGKGKETDSPIDPLEGLRFSWHLDFSPVRSMLDFWSPELQDNTFVLFWATTFVAIYYGSHRKLIQIPRQWDRKAAQNHSNKRNRKCPRKSQCFFWKGKFTGNSHLNFLRKFSSRVVISPKVTDSRADCLYTLSFFKGAKVISLTLI